MARNYAAPSAPMGGTALLALVNALSAFSWPTRGRGQSYAGRGRVGALDFDGPFVSAIVRGNHDYRSGWEWDGERWHPDCTCPVAPLCKHTYALACSILALGREGGFDHPRLASLLPPGIGSRQGATPLPLAPRAARRSALQRLREAPDIWTRQSALQELLASGPARLLNPYHAVFAEMLDEPDADLRCWRVANEIRLRADGWVPAELAGYSERSDLARRYAQRARVQLSERLIQWARTRRSVPQRSLRLVMKLERHPNGTAAISVETRLTAPRMTDAPRSFTQLRQLLTECRYAPEILPSDQAMLLDWLVTHNVGGTDPYYGGPGLTLTVLRQLLSHISGSPLVSWDEALPREEAARAGIAPNAPVILASEPARLLPACISRGGSTDIELQLFWPDGHQRALTDVLYFRSAQAVGSREPSLVLADGVFSVVIEEPPADIMELFARAGNLPLVLEQRRHIVSLLASHFPHLEGALAAHTKFHRTSPVVALDLRSDDWLQIRLLAPANAARWRPGEPLPDGAVLFEHSAEGWTRQADPPRGPSPDAVSYEPLPEPVESDRTADPDEALANQTAAESVAVPTGLLDADVWYEAPEPRSVDPVLAWLKEVESALGTNRGPISRRLEWEDHAVGRWFFLSRKRADAFAEAWEARPSGVAYFGNERLRRLLGGSQFLVPRLRVTSSGVDWFGISADWEAEGLRFSDADWNTLRNATTRFVKLSSGWVRRELTVQQEENLRVLADLGVEPGAGEQRLTIWQLAGAKPENLALVEEWSEGTEALAGVRELRRRVEAFTGLEPVPPPAALRAELRPYQQRGLDFLAHTSVLGVGAILADDMGLGKTVQALAWLAHLREKEEGFGPCLVVCPASVVHNWAREAERFTPNLRVLLLTRGQARHGLRASLGDHDLVLTNYALLRRDIEAWRSVDLGAAILDEAQNIKNPDAAVTKAARELRARHRLALTGTPLENRALDLWSIMQFVNPGYLGVRADFADSYDRPDTPPHMRALLAARLRPVLLRRTKRQVAPELPDRIEEQCDCELTAGQRKLYLAELRRSRTLVDELGRKMNGFARNRITILAALTRLRQICCHPALAGGKRELGSGKFDALFDLLDPLLAEGHKVLLFSQFVECLKLLASEMQVRGIAFHQLTGATVKREAVVSAFQEDERPCVFLISLKAGGTGLNLTAASYVVLFDPWWNPAVEAQAIDRSHRIGQDRTVIAYRMLSRGTVEEKIWELQQRKRALVDDLLGEDGFARTLTRQDLEYLLAVS